MKREAAANSSIYQTQTLDFADIPSQSKLFVDFLSAESGIVSQLWPNGSRSLSAFTRTALDQYTTDRKVLCDGLLEENRKYGAGTETVENIEKLRRSDCVAVITGQQAGLFSGPTYTVYKALSAVRIASDLRKDGINAVPVFWIATEDHDFEEIRRTEFIDARNNIVPSEIPIESESIAKPVGSITLNEDIGMVLSDLFSQLGATSHSKEFQDMLSSAYTVGTGLGDAFGRLLTSLLARYGLIFVNPLNEVVRRLSAPLSVKILENSESIEAALMERNEFLVSSGYHAQVNVEGNYVPFFIIDSDGRRKALTVDPANGSIRTKDKSREFTKEALIKEVLAAPEMLSPNALVRPVLQDFVFPTVCYVGGAAEISYFAQNSVIYELLGRPVTPVRHRSSITVLAARHRRTMETYGIELKDLFQGPDQLLEKLASKDTSPETLSIFEDTVSMIERQIAQIKKAVDGRDPGFLVNLEKRKKKIIWHVETIKSKFLKSESRRDDDLVRRLEDLFANVLPEETLQERRINFFQFFNQYGPTAVDVIYKNISADDRQHKFVTL